MDLDNYKEVAQDLSKSLSIDRDKILSISPFREPFFNFEEYVELLTKKPTLISDNCFGGVAYHFLGLQFNSPFINMWVHTEDLLKIAKKHENIYENIKLKKWLKTDPEVKTIQLF